MAYWLDGNELCPGLSSGVLLVETEDQALALAEALHVDEAADLIRIGDKREACELLSNAMRVLKAVPDLPFGSLVVRGYGYGGNNVAELRVYVNGNQVLELEEESPDLANLQFHLQHRIMPESCADVDPESLDLVREWNQKALDLVNALNIDQPLIWIDEMPSRGGELGRLKRGQAPPKSLAWVTQI